jgi:hypothetical protein
LSGFYDKDGRAIDLMTWARLREDPDYAVVALFKDTSITISTLWHGVDYDYLGAGAPMIFETKIFGEASAYVSPKLQEAQWRWQTEAEAKEGHDVLVDCYRNRIDPNEPVRAVRERHAGP